MRSFLRWPDARLRTPATPVGEVTDEHRRIWDEMLDLMYAMPGVGLAAPQIGVMLRLAVVDDGSGPTRLADPRVIAASAQLRTHEEASPNLPGVSAVVKRPRAVTVAFTDETGQSREEEFVFLRATSVQHQIDHLDGKMYFDRLSRTKRDILLRKAAKCA
ncbi:peptide deformylase [Jannaschia aquimarina]|uniref:Peptide deformylase-like n=1 Tax=Jannaschia aquimarina TaxID=935700 RepID=A0A0D1EBL6_9RHOB|nr:peptide deformylase [Jannaschia aquimarina]KIT14276.1 Peptide deformylase [Jannaschia aquimarina]SNS49800.1 peptide deformylase [Jannaschia aquimarina]